MYGNFSMDGQAIAKALQRLDHPEAVKQAALEELKVVAAESHLSLEECAARLSQLFESQHPAIQARMITQDASDRDTAVFAQALGIGANPRAWGLYNRFRRAAIIACEQNVTIKSLVEE